MADVALQPNRATTAKTARKRSSLHNALRRKSTVAFLMTLPLILLIALLVIYPAFYAIHLATLNKSMQRFVGLSISGAWNLLVRSSSHASSFSFDTLSGSGGIAGPFRILSVTS